jgi:O-antigen/teichoic acid export membrane protein
MVVGVILTLVLASSHGAVGGAIATTATEFVLASTYAILLVRRRSDLRPSLSVVPKVVLAAAVAVVPCLLVSPPSVVSVVAASVLFFAVAVRTRALPGEVVDALRRRL